MGIRSEKEKNASSLHRDLKVKTTGLAPKNKVPDEYGSETQKGHWAVASKANAGAHGKGELCLCQMQDLARDWPSLWCGLSGISEHQHFVPLLFPMIKVCAEKKCTFKQKKMYLQKNIKIMK